MSLESKLHLDAINDDPGEVVQPRCSKTRVILLVALALANGIVVGILIDKYVIQRQNERDVPLFPGAPDYLEREADSGISKKIMDAIDPARIEANLRFLTQYPHIAGKQRDFDLVKIIKSRFQESGLHVQITPYNVLLSYPSDETPNSVRLLNSSNHVVYDAIRDESNISQNKGVVPPFNAYSPPGLVEGNLVYAGYGRVEDYVWLQQNNISVKGNVVIVKYGKMFRGAKVDLAANNGATGIIIYSDPADYTGLKMGDPRVYRQTWWLPATGAQRGTIFTGEGDPLTPGYPSTNLTYRYPENMTSPSLPRIPCHPIGYGAAVHLLKELAGLEISPTSDFHGGLNITYRTGPGFVQQGMTIQLNVTSRNEMATVENVFGIIKGTIEPDRYVLFGNHRDAWTYGAIDPSSATAVMLELARVMGDLVKKGVWRPRRTIIFCSWGAEEYGLVGSTEWVEHYVSTLRERAVAYINVDIAVQGNDTLSVDGTPLMYNLIYEASRKVKNPNPDEIKAGRNTVYDTWLHKSPWNFTQKFKSTAPFIGNLGSSSNYAPLLQRAGVTSVDLSYTFDTDVYKVSAYPVYHTEYETFEVVKEQLDKDFEFHSAIARISGEMIRMLADPLILPFNVLNYAYALEVYRESLDRNFGAVLRLNLGSETYDKLRYVIESFQKDVEDFESRRRGIIKNNPYDLRKINDQLMLLEKAFLHPEGLPVRPLKKHVIFAENLNDAYAGNSFPGLVDLMFEIDKEPARWERVKQHFHTILSIIQTAGFTLRDVTNFMSETL